MRTRENIILNFENGLPKGTAQHKGERIATKYVNGRRVQYIHHYKTNAMSATRTEFELKLKRFRPKTPSEAPIKLTVYLFFSLKYPRKLWGTYKTTRPDCDNYAKELIDAMTAVGFWKDDAQVVDLHIVKRYAEKATIWIDWEELET